jgi:hypothetical protein
MDEFVIYHVPREENLKANALALQASSYNVQKRNFQERKPMIGDAEGCVLQNPVQLPPGRSNRVPRSDRPSGGQPYFNQCFFQIVEDEVKYLQDPKSMSDRKVRRWALKFVLDGDELYCRMADDLLLKCLGPDQARLAMAEVHEGICGTHQSTPKMKWLLRRACFYWPTMIADCFRSYKGCEECQKHKDVQLVLDAMLHPIIRPWPFRGWGLDFIGKIHPPLTKRHCFVIVATDYFTKWIETIPLKNMTHKEVSEFITKHIIHRFGIPQTLATDQGTSFVAKEVRDFVNSYGIKLLNSSPYYAQANGQAESSNKTVVKLIKKKIEDNP